MIISHRRRFVYLGPPKTASTTLHRWLSQPAFCDERWTPINQDQHATTIPDDCRDYFVFASIRNPFDRCVSLWAHSQSAASIRGGTSYRMTFRTFVLRYQPNATWFYRRSQTKILGGVQLGGVVRFEHLAEDLLGLPPITGLKELEPLPRLNATKHRRWEEYYDAELQRVVGERWREDVELPVLPPDAHRVDDQGHDAGAQGRH